MFYTKRYTVVSFSYSARVIMNGLAGVSTLVWLAAALALFINEAAALGGGLGSGGGGVSFPRPGGGGGGFTIGKK
ncbi:hypothetical protein MRX96_045646 [Rhipicephalus microplus]